ncbi:hypothetical protein ACXYMO_08405 [Arenibacterium sp. CAU 1754]
MLHIGQPKTGTTSLQHLLHTQSDHLAKAGVLYPKTAEDWEQHSVLIPHLTRVKTHTADCHFPPHWPGGSVPETSRLFWQSVREQMRDLRPELVILSGEGFFTIKKPAQLRRMSDLLTRKTSEVSVVAYLRSPVSLYASNYQQSMKMRGVPVRPRGYYYKPTLTAYREHGPGPLTLRPFERAQLTGGDVLHDFAHHFCPQLDVTQPEALNKSLSAEALWALQAIAEVKGIDPNAPVDHPEWPHISNVIARTDTRIEGASAPRLTPRAIEHAMETNRDAKWLCDVHGITFQDVDYDQLGAHPGVPEHPLRVEDAFELDLSRAEAILSASELGVATAKVATLLRNTVKRLQRRV